MKWDEVNLIYELKSPVHIGYLPSKASVISQTRYYVPGKNLWGAYTKVLTEKLFTDPSPREYYDVGKWFKNNVKFTYFYIYDGNSNSLLFPEYSDNGLKYGDMPLSEFQNKFIGSFISTEIDRSKGTAKDESLHELEFINPKYSSKSGIKNTQFFGKMFIKKEFSTNEIKDAVHRIKVNEKGITINDEDPFKVVFVGGELNYGFGKVERLYATPDTKLDFKFELDLDEKIYIDIADKTPLLGHLRYSERYQFSGDIEMISSRGYKEDKEEKKTETHKYPGADIAHPSLYFMPGSVIKGIQKISLGYEGYWNYCSPD